MPARTVLRGAGQGYTTLYITMDEPRRHTNANNHQGVFIRGSRGTNPGNNAGQISAQLHGRVGLADFTIKLDEDNPLSPDSREKRIERGDRPQYFPHSIYQFETNNWLSYKDRTNQHYFVIRLSVLLDPYPRNFLVQGGLDGNQNYPFGHDPATQYHIGMARMWIDSRGYVLVNDSTFVGTDSPLTSSNTGEYVEFRRNWMEVPGVVEILGHYVFMENNHKDGLNNIQSFQDAGRMSQGFFPRQYTYIAHNTIKNHGLHEEYVYSWSVDRTRHIAAGGTEYDWVPDPNRTPNFGRGADGEAIVFEDNGGGMRMSGHVESATADTVTVIPRRDANGTILSANTPIDQQWNFRTARWGNWHVLIKDGRGIGQWRIITAADPITRTFTLSDPWDVIPDASSQFSVIVGVGGIAYHNLIKDNETTISAYFNGFDTIIADNTIINSMGSFSDALITPAMYYISVSYFLSNIGNIIDGPATDPHRSVSQIGVRVSNEAQAFPVDFTVAYGTTIRRNVMKNLEHEPNFDERHGLGNGIMVVGINHIIPPEKPYIRGVVIEGNRLYDMPVGIRVNGLVTSSVAISDVIIRDNEFTNVGREVEHRGVANLWMDGKQLGAQRIHFANYGNVIYRSNSSSWGATSPVIYGNYLYVQTWQGNGGILVFDISDLRNPQDITDTNNADLHGLPPYETRGSTGSFSYLYDGVLYISFNDSVRAFCLVGNPSNPEMIARWNMADAGALKVEDGRLFVGGGSFMDMRVYNVSDIRNNIPNTFIELTDVRANAFDVVGNMVYGVRGVREVFVADISNLNTPNVSNRYFTGANIKYVIADGDYLYLNDFERNRVYRVRLEDAANFDKYQYFDLTTHRDLPVQNGGVHSMTVQNGVVFTAGVAHLAAFDLSQEPFEVIMRVNIGGFAHALSRVGNILVHSDFGDNVRLFRLDLE